MKRIVSIISFIAITLALTLNTYAADNTNKNIELNIKGQTSVKPSTQSIELTLSLGEFTGISENSLLGFEATLDFGAELFTSYKIEGLNGWNINYSTETKRIIGEVTSSKANTDITKITLNLKQGLTVGQTDTLNFKDIILTDGTNHFQYNKSITVTVVEESAKEKEQEEITVTPENTSNQNNSKTIYTTPAITENAQASSNVETNTNTSTSSNTGSITNSSSSTNTKTNSNSNSNVNSNVGGQSTQNTSSTQGKVADNTTTSTAMPHTGTQSIILIAIVITAIAIGVFRFKARKIK